MRTAALFGCALLISACGGVQPVGDGASPSSDAAGRTDSPGDFDGGDPTVDRCPDDPNKLRPGACGCGRPDDDTDLDGLADCVDPHPADSFAETEALRAGTARPHEVRTGYDFSAAGWDGRLFIGLRLQTVGGALVSTYTAELFRPELLTFDAQQRPQLGAAGLFASGMVFGTEDANHGFHVSICADPNFAENPHRSDAAGNVDPNGSFRTYRLGIIGIADGSTDQYLTFNRGRVVIADAQTPTARIVAASTGPGAATPITTVSGSRLHHYEPSVTPDCRLIVWHGRIENNPTGPAGVAMYSYNPNFSASGWSEGHGIADMYYRHGAGTPLEPSVAGVPFSQRYPFARQPMRDAEGRTLARGEPVFGPYPWVSFDGSEILFPVVPTFDGPARSAFSAVGARTGWTLRHLDGAINPSRSDLLSRGTAVAFPTPGGEGEQLTIAYNQHTLGDGSPLGTHGYQRLFAIPLALSQSMWTPFASADPNAILPGDSRRGVYAFFLSASTRYAEVDLHQIEDGHYLLYLPMNELVGLDRAARDRLLSGTLSNSESWVTRRLATPWVIDRTPDVSGHVQNATLRGGAQFPFEHDGAQARWQSFYERWSADRSIAATGADVAGDRIQGIVGNAIYFPGGASVEATLAAAARARLQSSAALTASLWVRPISAGASYSLLSVPGALEIRYAAGEIEASLTTDAGPRSLRSGTRAIAGQWQHVAIVARAGSFELWVDGQLARQEAIGRPAPASPGGAVIVGPRDAPRGGDVCLIDEVALSDVARTHAEIERAALVARVQRGGLATWSHARPAGLEAARAHLPEGFGAPSGAVIALGERLFFDPILSRDRDVSCATCHHADRAFTDGRARSVGVAEGARNAPALANRLFSTHQFYDGRAFSLEAQALMPIADPRELGFSVDGAVARVRDDAALRGAFVSAFALEDRDIDRSHLAGALAGYVRSLVSGASRFDTGQLTASELRGRGLFFGRARCASCHGGPNFTDESFHAIGFDLARGAHDGLGAITLRAADRGRFKTPSLRDVARTAPYFHDGSRATLADVIQFYNLGGDLRGAAPDLAMQPLGLSDQDKSDLEAFLNALTGTTLPRDRGLAASAAPRLMGGGAPGGVYLIGLDYGDAPIVRFYDSATATTPFLTVGSAALAVERGVTPPGWSGAWDNATLAVNDPALESALRGAGAWGAVVARGEESARLRLHRP